MKTLIILTAAVNSTITIDMVNNLRGYVGERNLDPEKCEGAPGCIYNGILSKEEKDEIAEHIYSVYNNREDFGIIFAEIDLNKTESNYLSLAEK